MIASESTHTHYGDVDRRFAAQKRAPALADECGIVAVSRGNGKAKKAGRLSAVLRRFFQERDLTGVIKLMLRNAVKHVVEVVPIWLRRLAGDFF